MDKNSPANGDDGKMATHASPVAVYMSTYVDPFIFNQFTMLRRNQAVILAENVVNSDQFPFSPIYACEKDKRLRARAWRKLGTIACGLGLRQYPPDDLARSRLWDLAFRKHRFNLIHAHFGPAGFQMLPFAARWRVPLVVSFWGYDMSKMLRAQWYKDKLKLLFEKATLLLPDCDYFRERMIVLGCPKEKVITSHDTADVHRFSRSPDRARSGERTIFLHVSRFQEKKGIGYLVQAFAAVAKERSDVELRLVGGGETFRKIETLVRQLGLGPKVWMTGRLPHSRIDREMAAADIFVHPSVVASDGDEEGIPTTMVEAMACGLPTIGTHHAGIPELLGNGRCGMLVPERDVAALAKAMLTLARDTDLCERLADAGRKQVQDHFSIDVCVKELEDLYDLAREGFYGAGKDRRRTAR
jgi:glycosyltransferase involved in cell wall biosynthesis